MNTETIKSRIAKLLRLAKDAGATEAEAANAMAKAAQLMAEHQIEVDASHGADGSPRVLWGINHEAHNQSNWPLVVLGAVCDLYGIRYIRTKRTYQFAGTADLIEAAEQTAEWLIAQINAIYKVHLKVFNGEMTYAQRCEYRSTFKDACALRLYHRVAEIKASMKNTIPNHKALVVVQDKVKAGIDDLFAERDIRKGRSLSLKFGSGTSAGRKAGDMIQLQRSAAMSSPARRIGQ